MRVLIHHAIDWIYPPRCISCRNPLPLQDKPRRKLWLCSYCENLFIPLETPGCSLCSVPVEAGVETCSSCYGKNFAFIHNRAGFEYDGLIRDLIRDIKFRRCKTIAQGLGQLWARNIGMSIPREAILVPLPMHKKKRRRRGFDQARILAEAISDATGLRLANLLERTQNTPPQSGLHPRQRAENVSGAFRINPKEKQSAKTIVLIDDIYTTGASLNECALTLKNAGANTISCMTLSITVKNKKETISLSD